MPCVVLTAGGAAIARSAAAAASASTGGGAADARRVLLKGRWRTRVQKVLSACKVQGPPTPVIKSAIKNLVYAGLYFYERRSGLWRTSRVQAALGAFMCDSA